MMLSLACPSCATSERVRCVVLGEDFWTNVGISILPFVVVLAVSYFVYGLERDGGIHA